MTQQEMWDAVQNNDVNYDGLFFYAVKTTGIFCRPSCKSKLPKRENICFFKTAEEAKAAGFRPCKRCRSDLLDYEPMRDIAKEVRKKIDAAATEPESAELDAIGLSSRRMCDIFKKEYGMTPKEYADSLRLHAAKEMLAGTEHKVIDTAYSTGFSNLSAFNRFFKKQTGLTPSEYRRSFRPTASRTVKLNFSSSLRPEDSKANSRTKSL